MKWKGYRGSRSSMLFLWVALLLILMGLTACSSSQNDSNSKAEASAAPAAQANEAEGFTVKSTAQTSTMDSSKSSSVSEAPALGSESKSSESSSNDTSVGGGIGPIADANAGFGRKVIYKANLVMKVTKFIDAEEQLLDLIHLSGAYVLQFSDSRNTDETGATYVIKVPSEGFSPFLEKMQQIKNLKFERQVEGSDVTEEFVDLQARLKAKQTVEVRLLAFMDKATTSNDLVKFSNELGSIQEEIEQIKGRMRYLDQNVAFSTINLRLYQAIGTELVIQEEDEEKGFAERINDSLAGSTKVLRQFGEGLLVVIAALLPVLIVVSVIGIPTYLFIRKRQFLRRSHSAERRKGLNAPLVNLQETQKDNLDSPPEPKLDPNEQEPTDGSR
jgi:regulator of replication initiation timing